jgi:DNA-binding beta-propeller fold protein YncE
MALIGLVSCSSGDSTSSTVAPSGSAGLSGPLVFVNNTGDKSLTSVALKGDSGNAVVGTIPSAEFEGGALGDMQFSEGNWLFMNLGAAHKVATIDPLTAATPVHEVNLTSGTRPVHLYRDTTDGEHIWSMNDGDNTPGATLGDDLINCAIQTGGSVTLLHNSHLGPGATPPFVIKTECLLADGHKVAAFSSGGAPKRVFISSTTAGEIAVIDNDPANVATYQKLIARIDLCDTAKEAPRPIPAVCNDESATGPTTPFTVNNSNPHGIRFSKLTEKIYSIQENYRTIVEIDPTTLAVTLLADLSTTDYTAYGISPDGRFLLLRGDTTPATGTKLGVIDLGTAGNPVTNFTIPELAGTSPGSFKFSPDSKRFYILAGNAAAATKKDRLFAFDSSTLIPTLPATQPALTLLPGGEIFLLATGAHSMDVLAQAPVGVPLGLGEAKYIVVSNSTANSVSIINAADNTIKQNVTVGPTPGGVTIYYPGAAAAGNQASS